jgi:hypothetical protein
MGRTRPRSTPGQLTLDDWEQTLSAAAEARDAREPDAGVDASASIDAPATNRGAAIRRRAAEVTARSHPGAIELLALPEALLTRTHLRELGLERRAVDAIFRALPVVALPGYSRPMVRAQDYLTLVRSNTFGDDRVRPIA